MKTAGNESVDSKSAAVFMPVGQAVVKTCIGSARRRTLPRRVSRGRKQQSELARFLFVVLPRRSRMGEN